MLPGGYFVYLQKMERAGEIVEELAFRTIPGRLANLLLDQFECVVDNYVSRDRPWMKWQPGLEPPAKWVI